MAIIPSSTRFVGIAPSVNLTEKKSNQLNSETQPYTMQDFQDSISPDLSPIVVDGNSVGIDADPTVTTQAVAVIESLTTNAGIVLKPNGTGAIMTDVPDGTTAGGNARGQYAVDLQMGTRDNSNQVASGLQSTIINGTRNRSSNTQASVINGDLNLASGSQSFVGNGSGNTASGQRSFIGNGFLNIASSDYSTISGGQSNTASTNSHATVVGGSTNTASGQYSVAGGYQNNATNRGSVALGYSCSASGIDSMAAGGQSGASGQSSICLGSESLATGIQSYVLGRLCRASGYASVALGYGADTNSKPYSNVFGGGGKSGNNNENVFANSVNQTNEGVTQQTGYYQRRLQIIGANSQNKGAATPTGQTIPSATTWGLSTTFNFLSLPTSYPSYTPLYDNVYFTFESTITMAVNIVNGTATGVSVGDYKIGKLLATGKKYGGVYSVISTNFTVIDESASMGTSTFELAVSAVGNFYIKFTAPTFTGGGDLDLTIMADNTITEMKQNL